jgi:hypothetical protein
LKTHAEVAVERYVRGEVNVYDFEFELDDLIEQGKFDAPVGLRIGGLRPPPAPSDAATSARPRPWPTETVRR